MIKHIRYNNNFRYFVIVVVTQVFVANPNKPKPILDILLRNQEKLIDFLTRFHTDRSEDEQFNDEKAYLIKQIKELKPIAGSSGMGGGSASNSNSTTPTTPPNQSLTGSSTAEGYTSFRSNWSDIHRYLKIFFIYITFFVVVFVCRLVVYHIIVSVFFSLSLFFSASFHFSSVYYLVLSPLRIGSSIL